MPTKTTRTTAGTLLRFLGLFLLTLLIIIAVCELLGWPFLRKPAERFMASSLERQVRIDRPFQLRLIGGIRLHAGGLWISAPDQFGVPHLVDAKDVVLNLRYRDLLDIKDGDPYLIKAIKVETISAELIRHQDGKSTWQFDKDESEPVRPFPIIETLIVRHGQAIVQDQLSAADLNIDFSTQEGSTDAAPASKVAIQGKFRERALKSELTTQGFLPIAAQSKDSPPVSSKGWLEYGALRVDFSGSVYDLFGEQNIKGQLDIKGPSLGVLGDLLSVTLPTTSPFRMVGSIEKMDNVWSTRFSSARVGQSDLSGYFKYDPRPQRATLEGELRGKRFVLADLAPAFGAKNAEGETVKPKNGRVIPDRPLDLATYNRMNAKISINLDYVDLGNAFAQPMAPFKADLNLDKSKLSLAKIYARTAQGTLAGSISIDAHDVQVSNPQQELKNPQQPQPDWHIDLTVKDINLEKWLQVSEDRKKEARSKGEEVPPAYVTGMLNGKAKLEGKGNSTAKLLSSLNGNVSFFIRDGSMSHLIVEALGLDLAQAIGLLIKGDESLPMQCAVMDLKAREGVITPSVALIDTPVTLVLIDGTIDMASENLKLRLAAKPKNFSPFTVRSPILVSGPFNEPKVTPEKGPIAARLAGGLALAFVNPLAAILPFLDPGNGDEKAAGHSCHRSLSDLEAANPEIRSKRVSAQSATKQPASKPQ